MVCYSVVEDQKTCKLWAASIQNMSQKLKGMKWHKSDSSITSVGEEGAIFLLWFTFDYVVSVRWGFPLPLGAWDRLRYFIVALSGPFIYIYFVVICIRRKNTVKPVLSNHIKQDIDKWLLIAP